MEEREQEIKKQRIVLLKTQMLNDLEETKAKQQAEMDMIRHEEERVSNSLILDPGSDHNNLDFKQFPRLADSHIYVFLLDSSPARRSSR